MIFTVENTAAKGKPVRLFDNSGAEIQFAVYANTETGEVEKYKAVDSGKIVCNFELGEIDREVVFFPAPLRFETVVN